MKKGITELGEFPQVFWLLVALIGFVDYVVIGHRTPQPGEPQQAIFLALLVFAAATVATWALAKPQNAKPAGLGEFQFPTATEGRAVPIVWGTVEIKAPNIVWYGDLIQEAIRANINPIKKQTIGYRYKVGMQFALCRGPIDLLLQIKIGDKVVFSGSAAHGATVSINEPDLYGGDKLGNGGVVGDLQLFAGNETQTASAYLSLFQQESGDTPAYRGTAYLAPLTDPTYVGNSPSLQPWAFRVRRIPNPLSLTNSGKVGTQHINPVTIAYEILTDQDWGLGEPVSRIDTANFVLAGATLNTENNGMSLLLDTTKDARAMLALIEEQIDGAIDFDRRTKKWRIRLARADYSAPSLLHSIDAEMVRYGRGSWANTTNQVRVEFHDLEDEYKQTFALAQDQANVAIQGRQVSVTQNYPGCKDRALANQLAWRDLRALGYPLAHAEIIEDRRFYNIVRGDIIRVSNTKLGLVEALFRVQEVDLGNIDTNQVRLTLVEDVFYFQAGSFGDPISSGWTPPGDDLDPFPSGEQFAFEAPRGLLSRLDPAAALSSRIFAMARRGGNEVQYDVFERHPSGSGSYVEIASDYDAFVLLGTLNATLSAGSGLPLASVTVVPGPDSQAAILDAFIDDPDDVNQGTNFTGLIYVNGEFMLAESATASGANVLLGNVWRGIMDTTQKTHASGSTVVFILGDRGVLGNNTLPVGPTTAEVKLLPESSTDQVLIGDATAISSIAVDRRFRRPYPPSRVSLEATAWATTISLEASGSGDGVGFLSSYRRRDYRITDEVTALGADSATLDATHTTTIEVRNDPAGANALLYTLTGITGASQQIERARVLRFTNGVLPTSMRLVLGSSHVDGGETLASTAAGNLSWDFAVTTGLTGQFNFGARTASVASNAFTVDAGGNDHVFTLSAAFTTGNVEWRLNGAGAWMLLISAGATTGTILEALIVNGDTIEIRHGSTDTGAIHLITMSDGAAAAYGVLYV